MKYRYRSVEYDSADKAKTWLLAWDVVYYEGRPLCEWNTFDSWIDSVCTASEVYLIVTDKEADSEIAK